MNYFAEQDPLDRALQNLSALPTTDHHLNYGFAQNVYEQRKAPQNYHYQHRQQPFQDQIILRKQDINYHTAINNPTSQITPFQTQIQSTTEYNPSPYNQPQSPLSRRDLGLAAQPYSPYEQYSPPQKQFRPQNVQFEDPYEKKRREREQRIFQEREEMAKLIQNDPFASLGRSPAPQGRRGQDITYQEKPLQETEVSKKVSVTIDYEQKDIKQKKALQQRAVLEQQIEERKQRTLLEKQKKLELELKEEQRIQREIVEMNRNEQLAREKEGQKVQQTNQYNQTEYERRINGRKNSNSIEVQRQSVTSLTPVLTKVKASNDGDRPLTVIKQNKSDSVSQRPDSKQSRGSVIKNAGQQQLLKVQKQQMPSSAQEYLLQNTENKFKDEIKKMQQEMLSQQEQFSENLRKLKNESLQNAYQQPQGLQSQLPISQHEYQINNQYQQYQNKPLEQQTHKFEARIAPQVQRNMAQDQKQFTATGQMQMQPSRLISNSEFVPKLHSNQYNPYQTNDYRNQANQIKYNTQPQVSSQNEMDIFDSETRAQLSQIDSLNSQGSILNTKFQSGTAESPSKYQQILVSLPQSPTQSQFGQVKRQSVQYQDQFQPIQADPYKEVTSSHKRSVSDVKQTVSPYNEQQSQYLMDVKRDIEMDRERAKLSYQDPQSPFFMANNIDDQKHRKDQEWETKEERVSPEVSELVKQFQSAAQCLSLDEQQEVSEIKMELLKMRNLPTLESILEQKGESGTHTFTRDLEDMLSN